MWETNCPVDVISVCSSKGEILPLRVQLKDRDHQLIRINVDQVLSSRQIEHVGAEAQIFQCRATVWDRKCIFELKFSFRSHTWHLLGKFS